MMKLQSFLPTLAATIGAGILSSSAQVLIPELVILDDGMEDTFYSSSSFSSFDNPDDVSFEILNQQGVGGNPGAYLEVVHVLDVDRDEFGEPVNGDGTSFVQSFFTNEVVRHNPSVDGGIAEISFSLDIRTTDPISTVFFGVSDGNGGSFGGFSSIFGNGEWQTVEVSGLTQADFGSRDFSGSDPLGFEFGLISSADTTFGPEEHVADIDNFKVTVTLVPEPSVSVFGVLGMLALLRRRR